MPVTPQEMSGLKYEVISPPAEVKLPLACWPHVPPQYPQDKVKCSHEANFLRLGCRKLEGVKNQENILRPLLSSPVGANSSENQSTCLITSAGGR